MHKGLTPLLALLLAACGTAAPSAPTAGLPSEGPPAQPTPDLSSACAPQANNGQATLYPGWPPEANFELLPVPIASELAVGPNRFLLNLLDAQNQPLGAPDRPVELRFYDVAKDPLEPAVTAQGTYMTVTENLPGIYRTQVDFPCWGEWGLEAVATEQDGSQRVGRMIFSVRPASSTPAVGASVPSSRTPTAGSAQEIATISTDDDPDPDFYTTSIDQALDGGEPFLVIFATPAFCRTATCAPALDIVKEAAAGHKNEVTFIHVEPYQLEVVEGGPQLLLNEQNQPVVVDSVLEWGLPTEPYIFVVNSEGLLAAKLEGVAAPDELEAALAEVAN